MILAVLLTTWACQLDRRAESVEQDSPRTYYESLNLASPEDAVLTFASAFQQEDFMTVYLVLDAEAQRLLRIESAQTFHWTHMIGEATDEGLWDDLDFDRITDTTADPWYLFDQIMLHAADQDDLLIDLRGSLDILRSEESVTGDGTQAVDVIADVEGVDGEVVFRTVTDGDGRWRVFLVSAPDEGIDSWPSTLLQDGP
jgi:hypothetical protein